MLTNILYVKVLQLSNNMKLTFAELMLLLCRTRNAVLVQRGVRGRKLFFDKGTGSLIIIPHVKLNRFQYITLKAEHTTGMRRHV